MLTRLDSPASVEPSVQILLRALTALGDALDGAAPAKAGMNWEAERRRERARLVERLERLGLILN